MYDQEASEKQIRAWTIAAVLAPLTHAAGAGWLTVLLACAVILPIALLSANGWKNMGKILSAVELVWVILVLTFLVKRSGLYWPAKNRLAVPITLLILAGLSYQVRKSAKVGAVLLCTMIMLFTPVLLCGISDVNVGWLKPEWSAWGWELVPVLLIPGLSGLWDVKGKRNLKAMIGVAAFGISIALITQGVLSPVICRQETAPLYILAQTLHIGGLSRFEAVVSMTITLGYYAMTSYLVCCGVELGERVGMKRFTALGIVLPITIGMLLLGMELSATEVAFGSLICWGLLPILCLKRKSKKSEKSA